MDSAEERLPISLIVGLVMTGFAMMSWLVRWLTGKATSATTVGMLMLGMCLLMISTWTGPSGVAAADNQCKDRTHRLEMSQCPELVALCFALEDAGTSWEEVIADAVERQEYVDVEETTTGGVDAEVCADVLGTGRSRFVTDRVMFQSGCECEAGLDSYNGTPVYMGEATYRASGLGPLLKVNLTVSHVGGGGLKILGLAKEAMLMIHSHPVTVDIIVGEMNISSSQMLIGMPAMAAKNTYIMCAEGTAGIEDDNGELLIFGRGNKRTADVPAKPPPPPDPTVAAVKSEKEDRWSTCVRQRACRKAYTHHLNLADAVSELVDEVHKRLTDLGLDDALGWTQDDVMLKAVPPDRRVALRKHPSYRKLTKGPRKEVDELMARGGELILVYWWWCGAFIDEARYSDSV